MKNFTALLPLGLLLLLLPACSKPDFGRNPNAPPVDFGFDYTFPPLPGYTGGPLTSNTTFKMIVREAGSGLAVEGAKLVFVDNGNRTDSLLSDAKGEILITGRDVAPNKCLVGAKGYWTHGYSFFLFDVLQRTDSIYRTPTVDSVVTYLAPEAWVKVAVANAGAYPEGSYYQAAISQQVNGNAASTATPKDISPAKDTSLYFRVLGNCTTTAYANLWLGNTPLTTAQSPSKQTGRGDTTLLEVHIE